MWPAILKMSASRLRASTGYCARSSEASFLKGDRDRRSGRFGGRRRKSVGHDHGDLAADELRRHRRKPIIPILGKAILDSDVLPLDKSGLVQALPECANQVLGAGRRRGAEKADHWHRRLLRARSERPRGCAAEERDELAALHSITSSASVSRLSEILSPSVFAVFKLITSSNLVGCRTGRSTGYGPLRIVAV